MSAATDPLLAHRTAAAVVAHRAGRAITAAQFIADAHATAARLRARTRADGSRARYVLNACADRYAFAVALAAGLIGGQVNLLPGSRAPGALADLAARYPDHIAVTDGELSAAFAEGFVLEVSGAAGKNWPPPPIDRAAPAAIAFTSGSTGEPLPQLKTWGSLVDGARAERVALDLETKDDAGPIVVVGTVAPQHMYGLESTVMLALHAPCALSAEHPLHAEQVAAALAAVPGRRVLVTTPVHLRALAGTDVVLPALHRVVCATAPLSEELAATCEARWSTEVREIYGCTEAGQVASRRTVDGPWWRTLAGVRIEARDGGFWVSGGHVREPAPLADRLQLQNAQTFLLEGRTADLVNVAGRRTSLAALNHALLAIEGVVDGTFFVPDASAVGREARLLAFVVAPGLRRADVLAALRTRIDAVFLPRPLMLVDALPRNAATGKLPRADLARLAAAAEGRA